jgi:hypothetical protein
LDGWRIGGISNINSLGPELGGQPPPRILVNRTRSAATAVENSHKRSAACRPTSQSLSTVALLAPARHQMARLHRRGGSQPAGSHWDARAAAGPGCFWRVVTKPARPEDAPATLTEKHGSKDCGGRRPGKFGRLAAVVQGEALERDPSAAAAEYLAEYRSDIESFITREIVDAITVPGRFELPPGRENYHAWVDPSGGSGDSMTLAISHAENDIGILDPCS